MAGYMASWGPKGFIIASNKIVSMQNLATTLTLKQDSENDTSGTQTTNTRGRELRPITFDVTYLAAAGVDPRGQIEEWEAQLGNAYALLIGGQRFGAPKMKLTQVDTSDIVLSPTGKFLKATVAITLEEYSDGKTSQLVDSSAANAKSAYDAKIEALNATASTSDRINSITAGKGSSFKGVALQ